MARPKNNSPTAEPPKTVQPVPYALPTPVVATAKKEVEDDEPEEKPKFNPGDTHKAPVISAQQVMVNFSRHSEIGRMQRLEQKARGDIDVKWLFDQYKTLKSEADKNAVKK